MALESTTLYKLIILYMLDRVDFPLSNSTLSSFMLETGYTDFATIQQIISVLQDDGLINVESNRLGTNYTLTDEGLEMLGYFNNKISDDIKKDVNDYLARNKYELKQSTNILSEYYQNTFGDFSVHCCVKENNESLIELIISVPDEESAELMCSKWKEKSQEVYEFIFKQMM